MKAALKAFNFHSFAKLRECVVDAKASLNQAQNELLNNLYDPILVDNEKRCLKVFQDLSSAEEGFLKHKSRIQCIKRDQNTSFFHKSIKARNSRNVIKVITFFFWIIKNLLPKRAMPKQTIAVQDANGHKSKRKSDNTSPINIG